MYKLEFSDTFDHDLDAAVNYIETEYLSNYVEENLFLDLHKKLFQIKYLPYSRTLIEDQFFGELGYRLISVKKYLLFYKVLEDIKIIKIARFIHSSRDWRSFVMDDLITE